MFKATQKLNCYINQYKQYQITSLQNQIKECEEKIEKYKTMDTNTFLSEGIDIEHAPNEFAGLMLKNNLYGFKINNQSIIGIGIEALNKVIETKNKIYKPWNFRYVCEFYGIEEVFTKIGLIEEVADER